MSSMGSTTSRKKNFTEYEKNWFLSCLYPFKNVIDNKQTDGRSLRAKNEAWLKIAKAFNESSQINEEATPKQLNRLYGNMKQRGEIARGKPVKNFEKGFVVQNDLSDNSANFNEENNFHFQIKVEDNTFSETSDSLMNNSNAPPASISPVRSRRFMSHSSLPDVTECMTLSGNDQLLDLEKQFFEERIRTQKEKTREARARAEIAELELELLRKKANRFSDC